MIKTLRITSIIAAIAAMVLLVLPAVYGVRRDPKIEEFLKSPGAVEKFTAAKGQGPAKKNTESPLVKEAAKYKEILNPTPPPPPKEQPGATPKGPAVPTPPAPVAIKFDLVATSYYASNPEKSFALIDEPGKGLHWVKQGSAVGHLTIETVKDGVIVVRDGQRTSEKAVKVQESWRSLLKNPPPSTQPSASSAEPADAAAQAPTGQGSEPSPVTTDKAGPSSPAKRSRPPTPSRPNPTSGLIPPASERITSPALPAPGQIVRPGPAAVQPRPIENKQAPPTSEPPSATPQVATQPAPQAATGDEPVVELSPREKEIRAKMDKLTAEIGSSKNEEETAAKMNEMAKLLEQLESENSPDVNN